MFGFFTSGMIEAHHLSQPIPKVRRARRKKKRLRQRIFWRDNGTCSYCGTKLKYDDCTLDHVISLVAGGSDKKKENFVLACWACNHRKGPLEMDHNLPENEDMSLEKLKNKWVSLDRGIR